MVKCRDSNWYQKQKKVEARKARRQEIREQKAAAKAEEAAAAAAADAFWSAMPGVPLGRAKASAARGTATPACGLGGRSPFSPHTLNGRQVAAALAKAASEKMEAEAAAAAKERELIELRAQLAAAKKQAKSKPAPPPFGRGRGMPCDCGCDGSETAHATNAFMTNGRSEDAAARKARRVGEKLEKALPDDPEQAGAALQQTIAKRPRVRAAADAAGIRTAGQIASAERIMARVQEAVKLFKMKSGGISDDVSMALNVPCLSFMLARAGDSGPMCV